MHQTLSVNASLGLEAVLRGGEGGPQQVAGHVGYLLPRPAQPLEAVPLSRAQGGLKMVRRFERGPVSPRAVYR